MLRTTSSCLAYRANVSCCQTIKDHAVCCSDYRVRASKCIVLASKPGFFVCSSQERDRNKDRAWGKRNEAWKGGRRNISLSFQGWKRDSILIPWSGLASLRVSEPGGAREDRRLQPWLLFLLLELAPFSCLKQPPLLITSFSNLR